MFSCLNAGVDAPNHLLELDEAGVKILLQKRLPFVVTLDDLIALEKGDLEATGGKSSRLRMAEQAFKRARAARVPIVYGSGATSDAIPHGKQADQFEYYVRWGMTPAQALQTALLPAAGMLNYGWANHVGSLQKGKFADVIAVSGNPLQDVSVLKACSCGTIADARSPSIQLLTTTRHIQSTFPIRMATAWRSPHTTVTSFARHPQNCASRPTSRQLAGSVRCSPAWIVANGEAG
jgi:hypothetical protein